MQYKMQDFTEMFNKIPQEQRKSFLDSFFKQGNTVEGYDQKTGKYTAPKINNPEYSIQGFAGNLSKSAMSFIKGLNPVSMIQGMGTIGGGMLEQIDPLLNKAFGINNPTNDQRKKVFDEFLKSYPEKYGSRKKIIDSIYNDPIGTLADASMLFGGGEAALGKLADIADVADLGKTSSALSKVSEFSGAASNVTNPLMPLEKGAKFLGAPLAGKFKKEVSKSVPLQTQSSLSAEELSRMSKEEINKKIEELKRTGVVQKRGIDKTIADIQSRIDQNNAHLQTFNDTVLPKIDISSREGGELVQSFVEQYDQAMKKEANDFYSSLSDTMKNKKVSMTKTQEYLKKVLPELSSTELESPYLSSLKNINKRINRVPGYSNQGNFISNLVEIRKYRKALEEYGSDQVDAIIGYGDKKKPPYDYTSFNAERERVGNEVSKEKGNKDWGIMNGLYGAMREDLNASIESADKSLAPQVKEMNTKYSLYKDTMQSKIISKIMDAEDPAKVMESFLSPNDLHGIETLKSVMNYDGTDRFSQVMPQMAVLDMMEKSGGDANKLLGLYGKWKDQKSIDALFTKDQQKAFDMMRKEKVKIESSNLSMADQMKALKDGLKKSNMSTKDTIEMANKVNEVRQSFLKGKTSFANGISKVKNYLASAVVLGEEMHGFHGTASVIDSLATFFLVSGGSAAFSSFLDSPFVDRWLTRGYSTPSFAKKALIPTRAGELYQQQQSAK
ncbi:MAG: hypothetical protein KGN01_06570 [Patescibacteria group bacterium]|nr:hypothetical protein [Patescibacteria group bacterium]